VESAIFLFTRRVLAFFRVNPAESFNQPDFFIRSACFYQSSGQPRVNPGEQEGGVQKNKKNRRVIFSRYLAANDGPPSTVRLTSRSHSRSPGRNNTINNTPTTNQANPRYHDTKRTRCPGTYLTVTAISAPAHVSTPDGIRPRSD